MYLPCQVSKNKIWGRGQIIWYLYGPFGAYFLLFCTLKASHARKHEWLYEETSYVVRLDELFRMVPRLTLFNLYFLRYGPLTGTTIW
jgi:hypothetical protein